jgi:squalene synthase HpnC
MSKAPVWDPGEKTHRDENFPVASHLISKRHRGVVLSFYRFARAADDVADDPHLSEAEKISILDCFEDTLLGKSNAIEDALPLRDAIQDRGLSPRHAQDLLIAFRMDASKHRYSDWNDLMHYCTYSAMPVGRFVLDVHGESRDTWPANDALCAALQIINHLQDCGADYRRLDRVYIPLDVLAERNVPVEALGASQSAPDLLACIHDLAAKTKTLLGQAHLSPGVRDLRLSLEVAAIERLARKLVEFLLVRDPLRERVHLGKAGFASILIAAVCLGLGRRIFAPRPVAGELRGIDDQPSHRS